MFQVNIGLSVQLPRDNFNFAENRYNFRYEIKEIKNKKQEIKNVTTVAAFKAKILHVFIVLHSFIYFYLFFKILIFFISFFFYFVS